MEFKRSHSRTSAEIIADNDDLLLAIIIRLPAKPLIRSQLVCKHWQFLILDPTFSHSHTRLQPHLPKPQPFFILNSIPHEFFSFRLSERVFRTFQFNTPYTKIVQSCNGLMLLESRNSRYGKKSYSVYNPTTKQSKSLRIERGDGNQKNFIYGVSLAFDPSISLHYKIIAVTSIEIDLPNYLVEVFDSESEEWTRVDSTFPPNVNRKFMNGIYMNNKIYWIRSSAISFCFDLEKGTIARAPDISTPPRKRGEFNKHFVMESNGHVHCVAIYVSPRNISILVFELLEENSFWFELHRGCVDPIAFGMLDIVYCDLVTVLGITRGETEGDLSVLLHLPGMVVCYRSLDGSAEEVLTFNPDPDEIYEHIKTYEHNKLQFGRQNSCQFIESLAPV